MFTTDGRTRSATPMNADCRLSATGTAATAGPTGDRVDHSAKAPTPRPTHRTPNATKRSVTRRPERLTAVVPFG
jgi:hypothetical protein